MPTNRRHARLLSYKSISKYHTLNTLRRRTFRNLPMSSSPTLKKSSILRRNVFDVNPSRVPHSPDSPNDQLDYVVFPVSDSSPHKETDNAHDTSKWTLNITLRKSNQVDPLSTKGKTGFSINKCAAMSETLQGTTTEEDDAVRFVKEIKKSSPRQDPCADNHITELAILDDECAAEQSCGDEQTSNSTTECFKNMNSGFFSEGDDKTTSSRLKMYDKLPAEDVQDSGRNQVFVKDNVIDLSAEQSQGDDDLVIVSSSHDKAENMSSRTLKRVIKCVVVNFLEESDPSQLTVQYVLGRLNTLHHCDFTDRISEIKSCTEHALSCFQSERLNQSFQEIRPGVRHVDIDTLSSDNWLNDIIINFYMKMLVDDQSGYAALSSFWFEEMLRGQEPVLPKGWEKMKKILAPVCVNSHWSLLAYVPSSNIVHMYSSLPVTDDEVKCGQVLLDFVNRKLRCPKMEGALHEVENLPHQENVNDCGVYVCMFARCIVCGNSFNIVAGQVTEFRHWLKNEIIKGRLFNAEHEIVGSN